MENPLIFKLLEELTLQYRFARHAWQDLPAAIQLNDPERVFYCVHTFLAHTANISRLLWPANPATANRGVHLRQELKVDAGSPLELRALRELLDRFDERLVEWAAASEHRSFVQINLMPVGTLAGFKADDFHRSFDPETFRGAFEGVTFDLRLLWKELQKLELSARNWLKSHNPW